MHAKVLLDGGSEIDLNIVDGDTVALVLGANGIELAPGEQVYAIRDGASEAVGPEETVKEGDALYIEREVTNG